MNDQLQKFFQKFLKKFKREGKFTKKTLVIFGFSIVTFLTLAWFTTADSIQNKFKSGNLLFDVILVDDFETPNQFEPDREFKKVVAAKNTEDVNAFVRILVFPAAIKDGEPFEVNWGDQVQPVGLDTTKWKDGKDGYYYYLDVLGPGETTPNLFEKVKLILPNAQKAKYEGVTFDIVAKTEAIHTKSYDYRLSWWGNKNAQTVEPLRTIDSTLENLAE